MAKRVVIYERSLKEARNSVLSADERRQSSSKLQTTSKAFFNWSSICSLPSTHLLPFAVWRLHITFVLPSVLLINLFDFYFSTRMHFIERHSILVQRKLISLLANDDGATLLEMKETTMELWLLSELLNERFEYTLLLTTTTKLIIFVIDIYWVYVRVIHFEHFNTEFISMCNKSSFSIVPAQTFLHFRRFHSLFASFDFVDWNFLLLQLRI